MQGDNYIYYKFMMLLYDSHLPKSHRSSPISKTFGAEGPVTDTNDEVGVILDLTARHRRHWWRCLRATRAMRASTVEPNQ